MKVNKNILVVGILVLLLIVGVAQAVQLGNIKSNMNDISISSSTSSGEISTSTSASTSSSSSGGVPTNIQNLPGMVGGC